MKHSELYLFDTEHTNENKIHNSKFLVSRILSESTGWHGSKKANTNFILFFRNQSIIIFKVGDVFFTNNKNEITNLSQ